MLVYLAEKTGKFLPAEGPARYDVMQWLFWQMGNLGPMSGQNNHFKNYAVDKLPYAIDRYRNEVNRLYGVLNRRLADREFLAGDYSIADMASYPWIVPWERQGQTIDDFPHLKRWLEAIKERPATAARLCARQGDQSEPGRHPHRGGAADPVRADRSVGRRRRCRRALTHPQMMTRIRASNRTARAREAQHEAVRLPSLRAEGEAIQKPLDCFVAALLAMT